MATTGISKIAELLAGSGSPIGPDDTDGDAVGIVQDLLLGLGFSGLPGVLGTSRGRFGPRTAASVRTFQDTCGLPVTGEVDRSTLQAMIGKPVTKPAASRGYLCLGLDLPFQGMTRVMSLTSQFEGAGLFGAINRNTDKAGLSYGLIQWAQKPGRLRELLGAFKTEQPQQFVQVLCGGDEDLAEGLLRHVAKSQGGVNGSGQTTDSRFDLVQDPWLSRFRAAALDPALQRVQVSTALQAFNDSFQRVQAFAPQLRSERAVAFMLDLANQHGDGGARSIFNAVARPGMSEEQLLLAMENESIARVQNQFGPGAFTDSARNRREAFRTSRLFSDQPFAPA